MGIETFEPAQFVVELQSWRWIAIRKIEARHDHPLDVRLDVSAMGILIIARQAAASFHRVLAAGQDGDPVPTLLTVPDGAIARVPD